MQKYVELKPTINFDQISPTSAMTKISSIQHTTPQDSARNNKNLRDIIMIENQAQSTSQNQTIGRENDSTSIVLDGNLQEKKIIAIQKVESMRKTKEMQRSSVLMPKNSESYLSDKTGYNQNELLKQNNELRIELLQQQEEHKKEVDSLQEQYNLMYQFTTKVQGEKNQLLQKLSDLKSDLSRTSVRNQSDILSLTEQNEILRETIRQVEEKNKILVDQLQRSTFQVDESGRLIEEIQSFIKHFDQNIKQFAMEHSLSFLLNCTNDFQTFEVAFDYLINFHNDKVAQEKKYQQHMKETVQIIFDLQNKCNDLYGSSEKLANSREARISAFNKDVYTDSEQITLLSKENQRLSDKIRNLKKQGHQINKKWKEFFDSFLNDSRFALTDYKQAIKNLESSNTISQDIVQNYYFAQNQFRQKYLLDRFLLKCQNQQQS